MGELSDSARDIELQFEAEERAYELLKWVPYSLPSEFDEELALAGYYTRLQRQRSDEAIKAFEKDHPHESSTELAAFRELERMKVLGQNDFYSPLKTDCGYYAKRLKAANATATRTAEVARIAPVTDGAGDGPPVADAEQSRRAGRRFRRERQRSTGLLGSGGTESGSGEDVQGGSAAGGN